MREIKFRAKQKFGSDKGKWWYGYFAKDHTGTSYITTLDGVDTAIVDEHTLGQFTGEKDVKGVEIYEDDIIMHGKESTYNPNPIHVVEFALGAFYMQNKNTLGELEFNNLDRLDIEVIGNIHEESEVQNG